MSTTENVTSGTGISSIPCLVCKGPLTVRLAQVYIDGWVPEEEYRRQKKQLEEKLRSLVVPDADAAVTAGKLLEDLPALWGKADLGERRRILLTMFDAVYVDHVEEKRIVAIRPRPAFRPLFEIATTREGSGIVLVSEKDLEKANQPPPYGHEADADSCWWWRRGRAEPHHKGHRPAILIERRHNQTWTHRVPRFARPYHALQAPGNALLAM